jgi:hypothetical protein
MTKKSFERRLYEAYCEGRGIRLTAKELDTIIGPDEAMQTRITNVAAQEIGMKPPGMAAGGFGRLTWKELGETGDSP